MARKNIQLKNQEVLGLMESAFRVASSQFRTNTNNGGDPVVNIGNTANTTEVEVKKNNQRSDTDQDLYTDKEIWVLNIPIQYSPVIIEQEDFDETQASTAQSRGILTEAENH